MLEQYASGSEWWRDIPFGWLMIIGAAFWAGLILQDLYNKESWIWENLRSLRQLFVIEGVSLTSKNDDDYEWFELVIKIKFSTFQNNVSFFPTNSKVFILKKYLNHVKLTN